MGIPVALHGFGGGGTSLNYDVVQYEPGAELPESAKANTIAVFTNVDITGHIFSATEPEALEEGMVWFSTGISSPVAFNALKKNGIEVYPMSAKQYVDGELVDVTAKTYQDGEWVEWIRYLLNAGGFSPELGSMTSYGENGRTITFSPISTGGVLAKVESTNTGYISAFSENAIDVTDYKTMRIETGAVSNAGIDIGINKTNNAVINSSMLVARVALTADSEIAIDLSGCTGNYFLAMVMSYQGYAYSAELLEIKLER